MLCVCILMRGLFIFNVLKKKDSIFSFLMYTAHLTAFPENLKIRNLMNIYKYFIQRKKVKKYIDTSCFFFLFNGSFSKEFTFRFWQNFVFVYKKKTT